MNVQNLTIGDSINKKLAFGPNFQTFDPAVVSFDIVWSGPITRLVSVPDGTLGNNFAGTYAETQVTVNWSGTTVWLLCGPSRISKARRKQSPHRPKWPRRNETWHSVTGRGRPMRR